MILYRRRDSVGGRHASHLHARRDCDATELLPAAVQEAARLRAVAPRDAAPDEQGDDDGDGDDHLGQIHFELALVVLDVGGHGHLFEGIAQGAYRAVRHAVARLEAHLVGDVVVVPVRARALIIRGAAVDVQLPPAFGVPKLPAGGRDVVVLVVAAVAAERARQGARAQQRGGEERRTGSHRACGWWYARGDCADPRIFFSVCVIWGK